MARRIKILFLGVMAFTISVLLYSSHLREIHTPDQRTLQDFYSKTKTALDQKSQLGSFGGPGPAGQTGTPILLDLDADGDIDEDDARLAREMAERLRAAEQQAKDQANAKAPNKPDLPSNVVGVGSSAGGQKKEGATAAETETEHAAEAELDNIVKRAPVIIFSKTYCPFSKRAKALLLEKYSMEPAPVVVELDTHPLGATLQSLLGELTGRRTVPNILVGGKSIGGGDDIAEMDREDVLISKITALAGKNFEMKLQPTT